MLPARRGQLPWSGGLISTTPGSPGLAVARVAGSCHNRLVLTLGMVVLGVAHVRRAAAFWSAALGYDLREDGFGGWSVALVPRGGSGAVLTAACITVPGEWASRPERYSESYLKPPRKRRNTPPSRGRDGPGGGACARSRPTGWS